MRGRWGTVAVAVMAGLVAGCAGGGSDGPGPTESATATAARPPVELNGELAFRPVTGKHVPPCRKKEVEDGGVCFTVSEGFSTRRVKDVKVLMPDARQGRTRAAVQVDFEAAEGALLAEITTKAHDAYLADPMAPERQIAITYDGEVMAVPVLEAGPIRSGSVEVSPGIVSEQEIKDLVARMTA